MNQSYSVKFGSLTCHPDFTNWSLRSNGFNLNGGRKTKTLVIIKVNLTPMCSVDENFKNNIFFKNSMAQNK